VPGLIHTGNRERALDWTRKALALDPDDPAVLYNVACDYSLLGMPNEALDCLEKAPSPGEWYQGRAEHASDPDFLRNLPRFQSLLKSL
jgi:hypothetical protein